MASNPTACNEVADQAAAARRIGVLPVSTVSGHCFDDLIRTGQMDESVLKIESSATKEPR